MRRVIRIIIKSSSGYFCNTPYEDKLVLSNDKISYSLEYDQRRSFLPEIEEEPVSIDDSWSHKYSIAEKVLVEEIFNYALNFKYLNNSISVLDGCGLHVIVKFDDGSKYETYDTYGGCVGPEYEEIFRLIQLVSFLIPKNKQLPDYFQNKENY